jgi:transcriptional regulator with XRE-family HTH domain
MTAGGGRARRRAQPVPTAFGRQIARWREDRGWTQFELAERGGVNQAFISAIETGRVKEPTMYYLKALARGFEMGLIDFLLAIDILAPGDLPRTDDPEIVQFLAAMRADQQFMALLETLGGDDDEVLADLVAAMRLHLRGVLRERGQRGSG